MLANFDPTDPSNPALTGVYNPDFLATPSPVAPDGGSPYEGQLKPLCDARLVELPTNASANSDFFIFTDAVGSEGVEGDETPTGAGIQMPGRIRGVLLDDLTVELDPSSPLYGDKRGIPNAPVGIRDFRGELITTVYSDENGHWEVLLPSTDIINCPTPGGVCPGMYQVIGNDPGTPQSPNEGWNPNYGTLRLTFDVWPGGTTYADVAILPITGFVQDPGNQFASPPICDVPARDSEPLLRVDALRRGGLDRQHHGQRLHGRDRHARRRGDPDGRELGDLDHRDDPRRHGARPPSAARQERRRGAARSGSPST